MPKRGFIPPLPPRSRLMRETFGVLIEIPQRSRALANRCIEQINMARKLEDS